MLSCPLAVSDSRILFLGILAAVRRKFKVSHSSTGEGARAVRRNGEGGSWRNTSVSTRQGPRAQFFTSDSHILFWAFGLGPGWGPLGLGLGARGPDWTGPGAGLPVLGGPLKSRQKMLTLEPLLILRPGALFSKERESRLRDPAQKPSSPA